MGRNGKKAALHKAAPMRGYSMVDEQGRPREYWGLEAISRRMGVTVDYIRRLGDELWFPVFAIPNPRRRHAHNLSSKWVYYTNEALIFHWQTAQVVAQREIRKKFGRRWWTKENRERIRGVELRASVTGGAGQKSAPAREGQG